jgi:UDP-N-acetylglucosamine--N-acetylmuramyl-(pentapeptide) pyrophosphoryl-undecaprenol N-acetylglucosamine transferase
MLIGGHLTPALALAQYMLQQGITNLLWVGTAHVETGSKALSFEYEEVKKLGIPFIEYRTGKLWRKWTLATFLQALYQLILIPIGFFDGLFILLKYRPDLVFGFGGYLQIPLLFWARLLRVKTAIHEQTMTAGTANLTSARFADKIFISWEMTKTLFPNKEPILSGNPIRSFLLEPIKNKQLFQNNKPIILVTGGNQGANTINWRLLEFLPEILKKANIIHQIGNSLTTNDYEKAKTLAAKLPEDLAKSYLFFSGDFSADFALYMQQADLILCRAGANTVTEILALGKRAILIPIPWSSQQEQLHNAELVARTGLGYILKQYDAMPSSEIAQALELGLVRIGNNEDFKGRDINLAQKEAKKLVELNSCEIIVKELFLLD